MVDSNPFDPILDQISELLAIAEENKSQPIKGEIDQDVLAELDFLEIQVDFFRRVTDQAIKMSGLSEEDMKNSIDTSMENPTSKPQKMIERAGKLRSQLQTLEKHYEMRAKVAKMQKKSVKSTGKKRKKKFKKLGGQGWLPL
jgi:hypothetical protein